MHKIIKHLIFLISISVNAQLDQIETNYNYDNLNRLVKVVFNNGTIYEYQYDKLGNRIDKKDHLELPLVSYNINTIGLTCINSNDGVIHIEADNKNDYNVEIDSPNNSFNENYVIGNSNDWKLDVESLKSGEYFIYITINGILESKYEKTFILNLKEPEILDTEEVWGPNGSGSFKFTIKVNKGTAPFTIKLNKKIVSTTNENQFSIDANHGDTVEVSTAKACEGKYIETLNILDTLVFSPNPTNDKVYFTLPHIDNVSKIEIQLFDINGRLIETFNNSISNRQTNISIQHLPSGVYLAKFPKLSETTFKIIKE